MYIDWDTVLTNGITNIGVGLILGFIGFKTWKWQHNYSNKVSVFNNMVTYLMKLNAEIDYISNPLNIDNIDISKRK